MNPAINFKSEEVTAFGGFDFDQTSKGIPAGNLNNAVYILESDPKLRNHVWYDEFRQRLMTGNPARDWQDSDDLELCIYIQRDIGITRMTREVVAQAVITVAHRNVRNCLREWLDSLQWDSEPRIEM